MIVFPRDLPGTGAAKARFELQRVDYLSPKSSGRLNSIAAGPPLWPGVGRRGPGGAARAEPGRAWITAPRGPQRQFYGRDVKRLMPYAYPLGFAGLNRAAGGGFDGTATAWSVDGTRSALSLMGLPAGLVLSVGDYVGFRWQTAGAERRALQRLVEGAVASASGVLTVAVEPALPTLVPAGAAAYLNNPCCLMRLVPDQTSIGEYDRRGAVADTVITGLQDLLP